MKLIIDYTEHPDIDCNQQLLDEQGNEIPWDLVLGARIERIERQSTGELVLNLRLQPKQKS